MKDKLSSYQRAIVKYSENLQRKNSFLKNALQDLQEAIAQDPGKTQGIDLAKLIYIYIYSYFSLY
jgi:hypothetical protein